MDVMLHKRCAKFIYVIPDGLRELMSDISREVIRTQPEHIYTFIADYLDALMITRENARVAARLVDSIIRIGATTVELLLNTGLSREDADRMATIIQCAFKQYLASKKESGQAEFEEETETEEEQDMVSNILDQYGEYIESESEAAAIIQRAFRAFKERHQREHQMLSGMIDWRVAARSAIYLYRKTGVTYEEANRAATLIKAAYKGYYTRRVMRRLLEEGRQLYEENEDRFQEEEETIELEEVQYEDTVTEAMPQKRWQDFYAQLMSIDGDEASPETDYYISSTEVADSIMDSVIKSIPSESEPGQTSAGDWTEGITTEQTIPEGLEAGAGSEVIEYLEKTLDESPELEEEAFESGTMTFIGKDSHGILLEGEAASSPEQIAYMEEIEEYIGDAEEAVESPDDIIQSPEEIPATADETEYSETIAESEVTTDLEPMGEV